MPTEPLYDTRAIRQIEEAAIARNEGVTLMERAGRASFELIRQRWPGIERIVVICGPGNNGGDGYVVARLARIAGLDSRVIRIGDPQRSSGDAAVARSAWLDYGGSEQSLDHPTLERAELVVDALFGIGLERDVSAHWLEAIEAINRHPGPVLSLDLPSGLDGDRGVALGGAVNATVTITFIALKRGLYTADGRDHSGEILLDRLGVDQRLRHPPGGVARLTWPPRPELAGQLLPRRRNVHKGQFGHLLVVGGDHGMGGAPLLAATAALRCGAGRVTIATRGQHALAAIAHQPEVMAREVDSGEQLRPLLATADAVVIGPGLGTDGWGRELLATTLDHRLPLLVDADALRLLATISTPGGRLLLTPHPGEAAALLDSESGAIQSDRFTSCERLRARYPDSVVVLKGSGTLIGGASGIALCDAGNPGMASAGMGDLLAGVIGALLARSVEMETAARLGVLLHAVAGDLAARDGECGLIATDLLPRLRSLINQPGQEREA